MSQTTERLVLAALKNFKSRGSHSLLQIVKAADLERETVEKALLALEDKGVVKLTESGRNPKWRLTTWADVDHDHIEKTARRGGAGYLYW